MDHLVSQKGVQRTFSSTFKKDEKEITNKSHDFFAQVQYLLSV